MKKNLWVLLALSALIAMFVIAGCAPKSTPTPTPTPTASPTVPPADTECPEYVSTDVYKYYDNLDCNECFAWLPIDDGDGVGQAMYTNCGENNYFGTFKIVITFNENIDPLLSSCVYNPKSWEFTVTNPDRLGIAEVIPYGVVIDGKKIIISAIVFEEGRNVIKPSPDPEDEIPIDYGFCGLICSAEDASQYAWVLNGEGKYSGFPYPGVKSAPKYVDEVYWKLDSTCVIADELGNFCCGFDGKDCCIEPFCESCAPCPIGSSTCQ
jgi:hypothetical protein